MLRRLRPQSLAGWIGWAAFAITFAAGPLMSVNSPLGFRVIDLPAYLVLAFLGGGFFYALSRSIGWGRRASSGQGRQPSSASFDQEVADSVARLIKGAEADGHEARRVRQEPWYADSVVDLDEVASCWLAEGHGLADTVLTVPNPYFVLPTESLVQWDFATRVEVREATRWAMSNTPPVRWQNPLLRERLNFMGWSDAEAYARIGLFHWRTDPQTPDPAAAAIEAKLRMSGQIYDVPRPANLA